MAGLLFGSCQSFPVFVAKKRTQGSCSDQYAGPVPVTLNALVTRAVRPLMVLNEKEG